MLFVVLNVEFCIGEELCMHRPNPKRTYIFVVLHFEFCIGEELCTRRFNPNVTHGHSLRNHCLLVYLLAYLSFLSHVGDPSNRCRRFLLSFASAQNVARAASILR